MLPCDKCRSSGGTALLRVIVRKQHAPFGNAVDVRGAVAHHPHIVGTDVRPADIIAPNYEDIRFLRLG